MRSGRLTDELRTRTKGFAASIIRLYVKLPRGREEVQVCAKQLLRSGTSVAAHCREASRARSDAEFVSKLGGGLQEADESQMWLELLREECGIDPQITKPIEQEAGELMAILTTIIRRTNNQSWILAPSNDSGAPL
jgi:four helix bundle protein